MLQTSSHGKKSRLFNFICLKKYDYKNSRFVADILENIEAYRKKRKKCNSTTFRSILFPVSRSLHVEFKKMELYYTYTSVALRSTAFPSACLNFSMPHWAL